MDTRYIGNPIIKILCYGDTRIVPIASILASLLWGSILFFNNNGLSRPTYRYMRSLLTEDQWVVVFASIVVLQGYRLFCSHSGLLADYAIKAYVMTIWSFISVSCMFSQTPIAVAMSDSVVLAVLTVWDFLRYNHREEGYLCKIFKI